MAEFQETIKQKCITVVLSLIEGRFGDSQMFATVCSKLQFGTMWLRLVALKAMLSSLTKNNVALVGLEKEKMKEKMKEKIDDLLSGALSLYTLVSRTPSCFAC